MTPPITTGSSRTDKSALTARLDMDKVTISPRRSLIPVRTVSALVLCDLSQTVGEITKLSSGALPKRKYAFDAMRSVPPRGSGWVADGAQRSRLAADPPATACGTDLAPRRRSAVTAHRCSATGRASERNRLLPFRVRGALPHDAEPRSLHSACNAYRSPALPFLPR